MPRVIRGGDVHFVVADDDNRPDIDKLIQRIREQRNLRKKEKKRNRGRKNRKRKN